MSDLLLLAQRFEVLAQLARDASTPFECAAVFAATDALARQFEGNRDRVTTYDLEKVTEARWHICAIVGYDVTNGHPTSEHYTWALGSIRTLQDLLSREAMASGEG